MKRWGFALLGLLAGFAHATCDPTLQPVYTTRNGIPKPQINACGWGAVLQSDFDIIDASMAALSANNAFTGSNTFLNATLKSGGSILFQNFNNTNGSSVQDDATSGKAAFIISAPDGMAINGNSQPGIADVLIYPGTSQTDGRFAILGSSANSSTAYSGFQTKSPISQSTIWSLPVADGTSGQALTTDGSAHLSFATISGGGSGPSGSITASSQNTIPRYSTAGSSNVVAGASNLTNDGSTVNISQTNTGAVNGIVITSTGTGNALFVNNLGEGGGGVQFDGSGAVNIKQTTLGDALVIVSSYSDAQVGSSDLLILDRNINRNDPIIRIIRNSNNSAPDFRVDSPAPNMEQIATSTDNAHGRGKWEPYATPFQSEILQVNSRAWDNTTFENVAYWEPLDIQSGVGTPGLYIRTQTLDNDSGIIISTNTGGINFFTQNNHTIGLTGPLNVASGSWRFRLPHTLNNQGQILYQASNGDAFNDRPWEFTTGGSTTQVLTNGGSGVPYWSTIGATTVLSSGVAFGSPTNTITQDTNTFTWDNTAKALTVVGDVNIGSTTDAPMAWDNGNGVFRLGGGFSDPFSWETINSGGSIYGIHVIGSGTALYASVGSATGLVPLSFANTAAQGTLSLGTNYTGTTLNSSPVGVLDSNFTPLKLSAQNTLGTPTVVSVVLQSTGVTISSNTTIAGTLSTTNLSVSSNVQTTLEFTPTKAIIFESNGGSSHSPFLQGDTSTNYMKFVNPDGLWIGGTSATSSNSLGPFVVISTFGAAGARASSSFGLVGSSADASTTFSGFIVSTKNIDQSILWTLPTRDGLTANQLMTTDGLGHLSFGNTWVNPNSKNATYTAVSTDTVILASATANAGITVNLTASNSVNKGQILTISKVDKSTQSVTIKANGTDLVVGTNTLTLNAFMQTDSIVADGNGNWIPWGQGVQITPTFIGPGFFGTTNNSVQSSTQVWCEEFYTPTPVTISSMTISIGVTGGNIDVGLYDTSGNRIASAGSIATPAAGYKRNIPFTSIVNLPPGSYWDCLTASALTQTFGGATTPTNNLLGVQSCTAASGNIPLPATLAFPCTVETSPRIFNMWNAVSGGAQ